MLNEVISRLSPRSETRLLLINLPKPPSGSPTDEAAAISYMQFLNTLTHGLAPVLLVRGADAQVQTVQGPPRLRPPSFDSPTPRSP